MNDYEKTIKDLQDRVKSLEERLTPCDGAVAEPKKWSPVGGGWWIDITGSVDIGKSNNEIKQFGIERPTQQQAERAAVEMRKFNRLLALRDELCGDVVVDFNDGSFKHYLSYCNSQKQWDVGSTIVTQFCAPFFATEESAERACDMLNSGEVVL
jgi:hypothetical protein